MAGKAKGKQNSRPLGSGEIGGLANLVVGSGIGILLANPLANPHPLRWGFGLVAAGMVVYLWPLLKR